MTIKNFTYTKDTGEKSLRRVIIISEATQNRLSADLSGRGLSLVQEEQLENVLISDGVLVIPLVCNIFSLIFLTCSLY